MSPSLSEIEIYATVLKYLYYIYIAVLIIGIIGNILNTCTFSSLKVFRQNQCALYLKTESIVNILTLVYLFFDHIIQYDDGSDLADYSLVWCKMRYVFDQMAQILPLAIICLTAFDQILATSHIYTLRQMSTFQLAQHLLFIIGCFSIIHSLPAVYLFHIFSPFGCSCDNRIAINYYLYFYYPVFVGILPIVFSSFFSLIAYRHVRQIIRLRVPLVRRRLDRQLTAMVFARVITFILLYLPYVVYRVFTLVKISNGNYDIPFVFDLVMQASVILLKDINYTIPFYVFVLSSSRFRRQVKFFIGKKCIRLLRKWCHRSRNQIEPTPADCREISISSQPKK